MFKVEIKMMTGEWKDAGKMMKFDGGKWVAPEFPTYDEAFAAFEEVYDAENYAFAVRIVPVKSAPRITRVTAEKLTDRNGGPNGYRYYANFSDGTREIIRAKATRLYENAFRVSESHHNPGNGNASGLARWFCFGKSPNKWVRDGIVETFKVEAAH